MPSCKFATSSTGHSKSKSSWENSTQRTSDSECVAALSDRSALAHARTILRCWGSLAIGGIAYRGTQTERAASLPLYFAVSSDLAVSKCFCKVSI